MPSTIEDSGESHLPHATDMSIGLKTQKNIRYKENIKSILLEIILEREVHITYGNIIEKRKNDNMGATKRMYRNGVGASYLLVANNY
ncbi:hypothetical protein ACJX0J_006097, partial [Zea mays]